MIPSSNPFASEIECLSIAELYSLCDEAVRALLAEFVPLTHASEISIWVKDPDANQLVVLLNNVGPAGGFEMSFTQDLTEGIVSKVYRDQMNHLDHGLWRDKGHSPAVDKKLHQLTQYEMCVPFHLAGHRLGVMSAVQLTDSKHNAPSRWGFEDADLQLLRLAALALGQAMERALLSRRLGH